MAKTQQEVEAFLTNLQYELDGHDEGKEWEDFQLGNYDAVDDILTPTRTPYTFDNLKETIMKYMGYLRAMEWYEGEGPHPPGWKFWDERFGARYNPHKDWVCPKCGSTHIEIRGHNLWRATQENGHVEDHEFPEQLVVNLMCLKCDHAQHISNGDDAEMWLE